MKRFALVVTIILWASSAYAANIRYVDSAAKGTNNGTSWANAWTALSNITGVQPGDTVYISGGPSGSSRTYTMTGSWVPLSGTSGNPITYKIGQDSTHNGTAYFKGSGTWLAGVASHDYIISGDAGDGLRHFTIADPSTNISNYGPTIINLSSGTRSNIRISYVNFGQVTVSGSRLKMMDIRGMSGLELDHTYSYVIGGATGVDPDCWLYIEASGSGYNVNKIHHNEIYLPHNPSGGTGPDGIKGGSNTSIYENLFVGYDPGGSPHLTQHQDAIQPLSGSYIKIYNNKFVDIGNYPIYLNAYYGDFTHVRVYNNLLMLTDPTVQASAPPQGIIAGPDGGTFAKLGRWPVFTDVIIANNTIADYGSNHKCAGLGGSVGEPTFIDCYMVNNICWNGGSFSSGPGVNVSNNIITSSGTHFVNYTQLSASNDFNLLPSDTTFKDRGTNLSSYFTTDKDGCPRPYDSSWDIGAYEYNPLCVRASNGGGNTLAKPMPPTSLTIN